MSQSDLESVFMPFCDWFIMRGLTCSVSRVLKKTELIIELLLNEYFKNRIQRWQSDKCSCVGVLISVVMIGWLVSWLTADWLISWLTGWLAG